MPITAQRKNCGKGQLFQILAEIALRPGYFGLAVPCLNELPTWPLHYHLEPGLSDNNLKIIERTY